ncbi:MAG: phospholipid carrier-dependent glycosyltransferase [Legionella sp.]|nr:MAG: phospholipid carrier-dependent glycosyltransferase [Legionella sp.]
MPQFWKNFATIGLILSLGFLIFFPRLDSLPYRGEEPRRVVSSFEMLQSNNWFVPTIQNQVFLSRPPLQNWVIALTGELRGSFDHLTGRLPSAICTLLTALLIYYYCLANLSMLTALLASLCFLTMPQVIQLGRTAETELMFTFLLSGSFLLWHRGELKQWPKSLKWGIAYLFLAGANLAKGINQAPLYFAAIIGLYLLINRQIRELFTLAHLFGLLVFCSLVGFWQWGFVHHVGAQTGWLMHAGDVGLRFQHFALKNYLQHWLNFPLELLAVMLPWSILIFAYLNREFWQKCIPDTARPIVIFCLSAIAITFFSVWFPPGAATRYYLPMYPCFAILAAIVLNTAVAPIANLHSGALTWIRLGPFLAKIGVLVIPLCGVLNFLWAYSNIQIIIPPQPLFNAGMFLVGTLLIGLGSYWGLRLDSAKRVYMPVIFYSLFAALTINLLYTDTRLKQYNDVENQLIAGLQKVPKDYPLMSIGQVPFDFLYYYMLHTGKTIPLVTYEQLINQPHGLWLYFFAHQVIPIPPLAEKLAEIETGRFKKEYSQTPVDKTFIVKLFLL